MVVEQHHLSECGIFAYASGVPPEKKSPAPQSRKSDRYIGIAPRGRFPVQVVPPNFETQPMPIHIQASGRDRHQRYGEP
jgi:hypothetical protein